MQPFQSMFVLTSTQWQIDHDTEAYVPYFFEQCLSLSKKRKSPDLNPIYVIVSPAEMRQFLEESLQDICS